VHYPGSWRVTSFGGNVDPSIEEGSWLRRAIDSLGRTFEPEAAKTSRKDSLDMPLAYFKDITPTPKQRDSVHTIFSNGTGDGHLVIAHTSMSMQVLFVLLGAAAGVALVLALSRRVRPSIGGSAIAFLALLLLAMAGRGWTPFLNGLFFATVAAALLRMVAESRRARA
jgi:hypothetical protein